MVPLSILTNVSTKTYNTPKDSHGYWHYSKLMAFQTGSCLSSATAPILALCTFRDKELVSQQKIKC